jgi:hypothetical protein
VVDRRWEWKDGAPTAAFFVIVENLTDRELHVTGVEVPNADTAVTVDGDPAFRLQPREDRELSAGIKSQAEGPIAPRVTVRIDGHKNVTAGAQPTVPLGSQLVAPGGDG